MKGGVKMNNLIKVLNKDGQLVVTSRQVARDFEKRHGDVLEKIDDLADEMNSAENSVQYFIKDGYRDRSGKSNREYLLTRDGFSLLVMGFTGAKALQWKMKYIEAFNKMEQTIKNPFKNLSKELQAVFVLDKRTQEIESRVDSLENNMDLNKYQSTYIDQPGMYEVTITIALKEGMLDPEARAIRHALAKIERAEVRVERGVFGTVALIVGLMLALIARMRE